MQNNSLIRTFAILFCFVSIYQLSFTFISSYQEDKATEYATNLISEENTDYIQLREITKINYLDSIGQIPISFFTSYDDAKTKELNRGLDLEGGINVILQISVRDILKGLAENSRDPSFNQALENADELQKQTNDPYIESFFEAFESLSDNLKLASPTIFPTASLFTDSFP